MAYQLVESDDSDDSLDELLQIVQEIPRRRFVMGRPNLFEELGEAEFRERFRLYKSVVLEICERIDEQIAPQNARNNVINSMDQLLITLRYVFVKT